MMMPPELPAIRAVQPGEHKPAQERQPASDENINAHPSNPLSAGEPAKKAGFKMQSDSLRAS
jgi:hypothetical protein